jgi:hypothetical protein
LLPITLDLSDGQSTGTTAPVTAGGRGNQSKKSQCSLTLHSFQVSGKR